MKPNAPENLTLELKQFVRAPRARVWAAWTNADLLAQWSCPEGMHVPEAEVDFREGGEWEVVMAANEDPTKRHVAFGSYREITEPERIIQTHQWRLPDGSTSPGTLVTITFHDEGDRTRITLTQTGFASADSRDGHAEGWESTLRNFAQLVEARQ